MLRIACLHLLKEFVVKFLPVTLELGFLAFELMTGHGRRFQAFNETGN